MSYLDEQEAFLREWDDLAAIRDEANRQRELRLRSLVDDELERLRLLLGNDYVRGPGKREEVIRRMVKQGTLPRDYVESADAS